MSNDAENPKDDKPLDAETSIAENIQSWYSGLTQQAAIYVIAIGYCLSGSLLAIINKWAVMKFPYPGTLTALQYFTCVVGVLVGGRVKLIEHDKLHLITMWRFLPAAAMFSMTIFTNNELLIHANVDTFIVFRSAGPIFVAIGESIFLQQTWPTLRTWSSLSIILAGSVIYVLTDYQFNLTAYSWAIAYLVTVSIDFVYIKHIVMTIGLNTWGLVLYNNLEALLLFPVVLLTGELGTMGHEVLDKPNFFTLPVVLPVAISCLFGLSISFFGFSCRKSISATGFTVLGVVNKLLTVIITLSVWDKQSSFIGAVGLLICLGGGILYQQSTSKKTNTSPAITAASSEIKETLLADEEQSRHSVP